MEAGLTNHVGSLAEIAGPLDIAEKSRVNWGKLKSTSLREGSWTMNLGENWLHRAEALMVGAAVVILVMAWLISRFVGA
jgi:hypothetical protein